MAVADGRRLVPTTNGCCWLASAAETLNPCIMWSGFGAEVCLEPLLKDDFKLDTEDELE